MKLILRSDVEALGRVGDIVTVKAGYGRNYLIPQGMASVASAANIKQFETDRRKLEAKAEALRSESQSLSEKLAAAEINIVVRVGEGDKLYGSVTAANIADTLAELGLEIDRRKILLDAPIRSLGAYPVEVKLHPEVRAELTVNVVKHGQPAEDTEEPESEQPESEEQA